MPLPVKDASGNTATLKTTLDTGEHITHHRIDGVVATLPSQASVGRVHVDSLTSVQAGTIATGPRVIRRVHASLTSGTAYLRLYDKGSAPATTDAPLLSMPIPAAGRSVELCGLPVTAGIGYRITGASPDNDATDPSAGVLDVALEYTS